MKKIKIIFLLSLCFCVSISLGWGTLPAIIGGGGAGYADLWRSWSESSISTLASDRIFLYFGEAGVIGDDETGQGGGLSGLDLVATENGNIPAAVGTPPSRLCTAASAQYWSLTSNATDVIANGTNKWSLIIKIENATTIRTVNYGCAEFSAANDYIWFGVETGGGFSFLAYVDTVAKISAATTNQPSTTEMLHIAMWSDGTYVRAGYIEGATGSGANGQPTKWSDFPATQRVTATVSCIWQPGDFATVRQIMRWAAGAGNSQTGKFYYAVFSKDCLIDNAL